MKRILATAVDGDGVLVNIEFEAVGVGTSPLTLSNVLLNFGLVTKFETVNGQVCVSPAAANTCVPGNGQVPEPGVLALLALAFAALGYGV